jgi:NAD(P)-dependent dehydrogenase (short-subunit alcohol dehydrogenase family)
MPAAEKSVHDRGKPTEMTIRAMAYLPGMQTLNWGRVIFIASESGFNIPVEMIHYGVSKTADIAVARGLAKRMAGTGITVNSVLPGPHAV